MTVLGVHVISFLSDFLSSSYGHTFPYLNFASTQAVIESSGLLTSVSFISYKDVLVRQNSGCKRTLALFHREENDDSSVKDRPHELQ